MPVTTVLTNNHWQAVRLPVDVRIPDDVKKVQVRVPGAERLISPIKQTWDSFFLDGGKTSDDFLLQRDSQTQAERVVLSF